MYCKRGHILDSKSVYIRLDNHKKECKMCRRLVNQRTAEKRKIERNFQPKTHCLHGHQFTEQNTRYDTRGDRYCNTCKRLKARYRKRLRRDNKSGLDTKYNANDSEYTKQLFNNQCFNCGSLERLEIDHHYPLSRGYGLSPHNAVLLCKSCNASKNNKMPEQFYTSDQIKTLNHMLSIPCV